MIRPRKLNYSERMSFGRITEIQKACETSPYLMSGDFIKDIATPNGDLSLADDKQREAGDDVEITPKMITL